MNYLIGLAFLFIAVNIYSTVMIYIFLKERKESVESFAFINFFIFKYLNDYKKITKRERGKIGYLFYLWIISINLALFSFVLLLFFL